MDDLFDAIDRELGEERVWVAHMVFIALSHTEHVKMHKELEGAHGTFFNLMFPTTPPEEDEANLIRNEEDENRTAPVI